MHMIPLIDAEELAQAYVRAVWALRDAGRWTCAEFDAYNLDETWDWCLNAVMDEDYENEHVRLMLGEAMVLRLEGK